MLAVHRTRGRFRRAGIGLVELLIGIGILVVIFVILSSALTGTKNSPGPRQQAKRQVNAINLNQVYMGFFLWGEDHQQQYPSTQNVPMMEADTAHDVFNVLITDGVVAGQQLISPNEFATGFEIGYAGNFSPMNTSFALNDYDADGWLRHRHWNNTRDGSFVLLSDRWVEIQGFEYNSINDTFWYALFNDGHGENIQSGALPNGDSLFDPDVEDFGSKDALMIHD